MAYKRFNNRVGKKTLEDFISVEAAKQSNSLDKYIAKVNKHNFEWGVDSPTHLELEGLTPTLGFEIETINGALPDSVWQKLNLEAVHDGSLRGPNGEDPQGGEYVTGVMYGDMGFKHLYKICQELNKYCDIDKRCGVHVHIGNLNWTEEDIVYAYILALQIEKEGYSLLPVSRRKNSFCKNLEILPGFIERLVKAKKTSKVEYDITIEELYNELFLYVSGGVSQSNNCNKNTNHPKGSKCRYDKKSQRYCWLNFVTLIFDTKENLNAKTLEIRSHGATMNYSKIKNWTKIWVAFTNFVTNYKSAIINGHVKHKEKSYGISLETMVALAYPKSGKKLIEFMRERKTTFSTKGEEVDYVKTNNKDTDSFSELLRR